MIQTFTWMQSAAKDDYTNHAQFRWKKKPPRRTTSRVPWTTLAARSLIFDRWSQWTTDMIYVHRTLGRLCHVSFYMFPYSMYFASDGLVVSLLWAQSVLKISFVFMSWNSGAKNGVELKDAVSFEQRRPRRAVSRFDVYRLNIDDQHFGHIQNMSKSKSFSKWTSTRAFSSSLVGWTFLPFGCRLGIPFFRWAADLYGVEVIELLCSAYEGFWYVSHQELTYMKRYDMKRYDMKGYA